MSETNDFREMIVGFLKEAWADLADKAEIEKIRRLQEAWDRHDEREEKNRISRLPIGLAFCRKFGLSVRAHIPRTWYRYRAEDEEVEALARFRGETSDEQTRNKYNVWIELNRSLEEALFIEPRRDWDAEPGVQSNSAEAFAMTGNLHAQCIAALGGKCQHCGKTELSVLQIDHIDGGGNKHRERVGQQGVYADVMKYGVAIFQCLCVECNWLKRKTNNELAR